MNKMTKKKLNLNTFFDLTRWQAIQDRFQDCLGINIFSVDLKGVPLTKPNKPSNLCWRNESSQGLSLGDKCKDCVINLMNNFQNKKQTFASESCFKGLDVFIYPIRLRDSQALAYCIVGPVVINRPNKTIDYKAISSDLGINEEEFKDKLRLIKTFTFWGIKSLVELLSDITDYIVDLSYQRHLLFKKYTIGPTVDAVVSEAYNSFYTDELLSTLLDVAMHTTGADTGSIMLLDNRTKELIIRVSRGIKEDIVRSTRLKLGEGISGLVAQNEKPLLLDDSVKDSRIKSRLKRPQIKSSIVSPLKTKDRVFGVVSINSHKPSNRFAKETLDLVEQLSKLTGVAMVNLPSRI